MYKPNLFTGVCEGILEQSAYKGGIIIVESWLTGSPHLHEENQKT